MGFYLVTGGAGFIGSHLVEELVRHGEKVRVLDNFLTGFRHNLKPFISRIELIEGDIRDMDTCRRAVAGIDYVLHQAARGSVPRSIDDPKLSNDINITGTLNMLVAAKEASMQRFVFASSSTVYGSEDKLPKREGWEGIPLSPYAVTKVAGEKYCQVFFRTFGLETVILRYFNVFGPRQDPSSQYSAVIPRFITSIMEGRSPVIYGDGLQSRDFTYVANVVQANLQACQVPGIGGEVFNIACGGRISINELAEQIKEILISAVEPVHDQPRPGDILHSWADISRAAGVLGYRPQVGFREGLERTVRWYKERSA